MRPQLEHWDREAMVVDTPVVEAGEDITVVEVLTVQEEAVARATPVVPILLPGLG
jgi:hypothetical protein